MRNFIFFILLILFLNVSNDTTKRPKKFLNILHKDHHFLRKLETYEGILNGFYNYELKSNVINFYAKIKYPKGVNITKESSETKIIPLIISYTNEKNKTTVNENATCNNIDDCDETRRYCTIKCSLQVNNNNISKVKFNDNDSKNKYTLSSLAHTTKDISSQKEKENKNSELLNIANISLLEHANISLKSGRHFVISGVLDDDGFESDDIKLIIANNYKRDLSCTGKKDSYYTKKYLLDCDTSISSIKTNLQNTFAYLEDNKDKGFIINFDGSSNSSTIETNDYIPKKKSTGISTGGIIAIVIPCILLLLLAVGLVFSLRKRAPNPPLKELANNNTIGAVGASSEVVVNQ